MKKAAKKTKRELDALSACTGPAGGKIHKIHPQLRTNTSYCFFKVAMRMRAKLDEGLIPYQLVVPQYAMLRLLGIEGRLNQVELGNFMAMDKATMVRMIDGLEQKNYLRRVQNESDRRAKWLELTPAGKKLLAVLNKYRERHEAEFLAPLTEAEKKQLHTIVNKLLV